MYHQKILLYLISIIFVFKSSEATQYHPEKPCLENEVLQDSGIDCATCSNYMLVRCAVINERRCYCKPGYVRHDETNKCTLTSDCPSTEKKCSLNETFQNSGYDCQTCALQTVKCALEHKPKCYCKAGYIRDNYANCILRNDCQPSIVCGVNETPVNCINPCQPTCEEPNPPICNFLVCNEGCVCKSGYIKNNATGSCIPKTFCPKNCIKSNQVFNECGSRCPPTCHNKSPICIAVCTPGCFCKSSYVLDEKSGECILESDCP